MALRCNAGDEWRRRTSDVRALRQRAGMLFLLWTALVQWCPYARAQYLLGQPPRDAAAPAGTREGWTFRPTLNAEETYTDNVRLARTGAERSDWVTTLRPGLVVSNTGRRLRLQLDYSPLLVYREREDTHDVFHFLRGNGTAELVDDLLFFDAQAYMSRQNVSLLGPQAQSDVNNTGNRTSVRAYNLSPYLRHDFGTSARGELRYSRSDVSYGGSSLYSSEGDRVDATLASGPAFRLLTWNVNYVKDHVRYTEINQSIDLQRGSIGAKRLLTSTFGILVNAGYEDNTYVTVGQAPKGKFWSVGPDWAITPRTSLTATTGRRFFGPTHTLNFRHRTRLTTWALDYVEDITTGRGQLFVPQGFDTASYLDQLFLPRIPNPVDRHAAVDTLMARSGLPPTLTLPVNYLTTVPFLQKRLQGSFAITGVRNSVFVNAYRQTRDVAAADAAVTQVAAGDLGFSPKTVQTGGGVLWSSRITPLTTTNVSVDVVRNELPSISREDTLTIARIGVVKQFQPRVSGSLTFRRLQNHSNVPNAGYRENAIVAGITIRF